MLKYLLHSCLQWLNTYKNLDALCHLSCVLLLYRYIAFNYIKYCVVEQLVTN